MSSDFEVARRILDSEAAKQAYDQLDNGVLALALWATAPDAMKILAHVAYEADEHGFPTALRGIQFCCEQTSPGESREVLQAWKREGGSQSTWDAFAKSQVTFDRKAHLLFVVHPVNMVVLLKELGLPAINWEVFDRLVAEAGPLPEVASRCIRSLRSTDGEPDLSEAPFDDAHILSAVMHKAADRRIRDRVLQSARDDIDIVKIAIERDDPTVVAEMLDHGCSVEMVDPYDSVGRSKLIHIAGASPKVTELLLARGAHPKSRNELEETPMHTARHPKVVQLLLEAGVDANVEDGDEEVPLHHLMRRTVDRPAGLNARCLVALLDAGADPFYMPEGAGRNYLTPFQEAVSRGHKEHVQTIIDRFPVDLGQRSLGGKTLVQLASKDPAMKAVLRAAKSGASIEASVSGVECAASTDMAKGPVSRPDKMAL